MSKFPYTNIPQKPVIILHKRPFYTPAETNELLNHKLLVERLNMYNKIVKEYNKMLCLFHFKLKQIKNSNDYKLLMYKLFNLEEKVTTLAQLPKEIILNISEWLINGFCCVSINKLNTDYVNLMQSMHYPLYNFNIHPALENYYLNCQGNCLHSNKAQILPFTFENGKIVRLAIVPNCKLLILLYRQPLLNATHLYILLFTYYYLMEYVDINVDAKNKLQLSILQTPFCNKMEKIQEKLNKDHSTQIKEYKDRMKYHSCNYDNRDHDITCSIIEYFFDYYSNNSGTYDHETDTVKQFLINDKIVNVQYDEESLVLGLCENFSITISYSMYLRELVEYGDETITFTKSFFCSSHKYDANLTQHCEDGISVFDTVMHIVQNKQELLRFVKKLCSLQKDGKLIAQYQIADKLYEIIRSNGLLPSNLDATIDSLKF